jgi:hypothetical protein
MKPVLILAALLAFGALRLPLERGLAAARVDAGLRDDTGATMNMREQVSQASLVALLGGLRSMAAAIWDLWACTAWEKTNYAQVERDYLFCQRLQPRTFYYYDRGQWMMAYNAAHFYELQNTERGALNALLRSAYTDKGLVMLRTGQRFLPKEPRLHEQEAALYRDKIRPRQPEKEAAAWGRAADCPGAPAYARRMQAYALAHVPGQEREAEAMLRGVFNDWTEHRTSRPPPTLTNLLEIYDLCRQVEENPAADARSIYTRLRAICDRSSPSRIPQLWAMLRRLESRLDIPIPERTPEPPTEPAVGTL